MTPLGLHEPGRSPLHRLPAGAKFLGLLAFALVVVLVGSPPVLGCVVLAVLAGYALARVSRRRCWQAGRLVVPVALAVFALQWWLRDLDSALVVSLRLCAAVGAANLFTLTTRVEDLIAAVERGLRPARRLGLRPERIGLLVGLTLQAVAALSSIAAQTREAQRARGADRSPAAFAVPFLVRTLRHADELGEALAARGVDD